MNYVYLLLLCTLLFCTSGCFLTKIVTVPMRAAGAVISVIPQAGDVAHDAIDEVAAEIDDIPI